jgi:hypothetical protein
MNSVVMERMARYQISIDEVYDTFDLYYAIAHQSSLSEESLPV